MIEKLSTLLVMPRKKYYLYCKQCKQVYEDDLSLYRNQVTCPVHRKPMKWIDENDIDKYQEAQL